MRRDPYLGPNLPNYNENGIWSLHKQYMREQIGNWNLNGLQAGYVRPVDWLPLPIISDSEEKFAGLFAVFDNDSNFVSIRATGDFTVDWGDGTSPINYSTGSSASYSYDFNTIDSGTLTTEGYKQVIITVVPQAGNNILTLNICNFNPPQPTLAIGWLDIEINAENMTNFSIDNNSSQTGAFNLQKIVIRKNNVSNWSSFAGTCSNLEYFSADMSSATSLSTVFNRYPVTARQLKHVDIYNTSNCTNFSFLFSGCQSLVTIPLFDTSSGTNFQNMFEGCYSLEYIPLIDTSSGTNFQNMFQYCFKLQTIPQLDTSSGVNFTNMFERAGIFSIPVIDTTLCTDFSSMFNGCYKLLEIPNLNTSAGVSFSRFAQNCYSLKAVPLIDTSSGTNFSHMFDGCYSIKGVPTFNMPNCSDLSYMFQNCYSLERLPLINVSTATTMHDMFSGCVSLRLIPLIDTSNVTEFNNIFNGCISLSSIPQLNTSSGTNFSFMFSNCESLASAPLLDTSAGTDFNNMFNGCKILQSCPNLNTSNGTSFGGMFFNCSSIEKIGRLDFAGGADISNTFNGNFSLGNVDIQNISHTFSISSAKMSKQNLEKLFMNLDTAFDNSQAINISNNWGIGSVVTRTGTTTAGSNVITIGSTTGIIPGMLVTGSGVFDPVSVSLNPTGNLVVRNNHGLQNNTPISFNDIVTTTGITTYIPYYIVNSTVNNFQISTSIQGPHIELIGSGSGDILYPSYVDNVIIDTSVSITSPATSSNGSNTLDFNSLDRTYPILKNWQIIG